MDSSPSISFVTFILYALILIPILVLDIRAVLEISKLSYKLRKQKLIWTNIVLLLPLIGFFMYYFNGRKNLVELNNKLTNTH